MQRASSQLVVRELLGHAAVSLKAGPKVSRAVMDVSAGKSNGNACHECCRCSSAFDGDYALVVDNWPVLPPAPK